MNNRRKGLQSKRLRDDKYVDRHAKITNAPFSYLSGVETAAGFRLLFLSVAASGGTEAEAIAAAVDADDADAAGAVAPAGIAGAVAVDVAVAALRSLPLRTCPRSRTSVACKSSSECCCAHH